MKKVCVFLIAIFCFQISIFAQSDKKAEVFVLSTLHRFHGTKEYYSFETLSRVIEKFDPDIIAVELSPPDLESRKSQKVKLEYEKSVFPLADKYKYELVALEPAEPKYGEIVKLVVDSSKELSEKSPGKAEAFSVYSNSLYDHLFEKWRSPLDVNSAETDAQFAVKHEFQNRLFGENERQGWERWNTHFLEIILETARENPGKRILVTVGVEHSYWLRKRLKENPAVKLLMPEEVLK